MLPSSSSTEVVAIFLEWRAHLLSHSVHHDYIISVLRTKHRDETKLRVEVYQCKFEGAPDEEINVMVAKNENGRICNQMRCRKLLIIHVLQLMHYTKI